MPQTQARPRAVYIYPGGYTMTIQAIQTEYKGYRFRSRLEARWAVFFDALGIDWEYEKEGYVVGGEPYLPDFYLPGVNGGCFIEIKGSEPSERERNLAAWLADQCSCQVFIFFGKIPDVSDGGHIFETQSAIAYIADAYTDYEYMFCVCPSCGKIGIEFNGRGARVCRHTDNDKHYAYAHPRLISAYKAARAARFEHGEKP